MARQMVHQVSVQVSELGYNLMSIQEFLEIPLEERAELHMRHRIEYLDEAGNRVALMEAIRQIGLMRRDKDIATGTNFFLH